MNKKKFRFAIMGAGGIANKFCQIESERVPHKLTIECAKVFDCLYK